jgi:MFS family permease
MTKSRFIGLVGNLLENYDSALFSLTAPFLAPLFFADQDPIIALILTYAILPLGIITKPLGAFVFGRIGDTLGRSRALSISLIGTAFTTMMIGFLPIYKEIGPLAPLLLALSRMVQKFFAAGESTGCAIFLLEQTDKNKQGFVSSLYNLSSIGGIMLASALVTLLAYNGSIETNWRILFWIGSLTAVFGLVFRRTTNHTPTPKLSLKNYKTPFIVIMIVSGFSHITYDLSFTFMNGYIPLITSHSQTDIIGINTVLLLVDLALLPLFGLLSMRIGKEKLMSTSALLLSLLAIPLFALIPDASLLTLTLIRLTIITLGVAFAAPYYAWALDLAPPSHRYTFLALASALGSQIIGAPSPAISLWLYHNTHSPLAPALFLTAIALTSALLIRHQAEPLRSSLKRIS